jgi:hypothetical protein
MPDKLLVAEYNSENINRIMACHPFGPYLYIGTSPDGLVLRTKDGFSHEEFWRIDDKQITAIADFGNALFFGTSPNGKIYMHNFNTDNRFHVVDSGDYEISAFAVHNSILYAATGPSGLVLSFDGREWEKEYDAHGGRINKMVSLNGNLYIFLDQSETIPFRNEDGIWELLDEGTDPFSIVGHKNVTTSLRSLEKNENFDHSFTTAAVFNSKLMFSGALRAALYEFDGAKVNQVFQTEGERINAIEPVGDTQLFIAVDDKVYVHNSVINSEEESSDG